MTEGMAVKLQVAVAFIFYQLDHSSSIESTLSVEALEKREEHVFFFHRWGGDNFREFSK